MKRKIILSTTIVSICLALAVFCVSVYAAMTQEFSMTNTIGFVSSNNIYFTFKGEVSNCKQTEATNFGSYATKDEYLESKGLKFSQEFKEEDRQNSDLPSSYTWAILEPIVFIDDKTAIVYTVELYNYSEVKVNLTLSFDQTGTKIANQISCEITHNSKVSSQSSVTIDDYTGAQEILLDEYVIGQSEQPSKCTFTITTSITGESNREFKESNNFTIEAQKAN